jgi:hypothetical protein
VKPVGVSNIENGKLMNETEAVMTNDNEKVKTEDENNDE